jgi:hypothetical protein
MHETGFSPFPSIFDRSILLLRLLTPRHIFSPLGDGGDPYDNLEKNEGLFGKSSDPI